LRNLPVDRRAMNGAMNRVRGAYSCYALQVSEDLKIPLSDAAAVEEIMRTCVLNHGDYDANLDDVYPEEFERAERKALSLLPILRSKGLAPR